MRIKKSSSLLLAAAVAVAIAAPSAAGPNREKGEHPSDFTNQEQNYDEQCNDDEQDRVQVDGTDVLWPPNHREVPYTVTALDQEEDDEVISMTITVTHDEVGMTGAGDPNNTDATVDGMDASNGVTVTAAEGENSVSADVTLLAERSGQGDGREYTITIDAEFDENMCQHTYTVDVPHDMGVKPQDERGRQADEDA